MRAFVLAGVMIQACAFGATAEVSPLRLEAGAVRPTPCDRPDFEI